MKKVIKTISMLGLLCSIGTSIAFANVNDLSSHCSHKEHRITTLGSPEHEVDPGGGGVHTHRYTNYSHTVTDSDGWAIYSVYTCVCGASTKVWA